MNRRGYLLDAIPIVIGLFIAAVMIVVALMVVSNINAGVQQLTGSEAAQAKSITAETNTNIAWVLDFFFVMLLISLPLASMVLAFLNNIPPFFFWASIGVILALLYLGGTLGNAFEIFAEDSLVSDQLLRVPMTNFVLTHYGMYALFVVLIIAAGVFIKTRSQSGYYQ